MTLLLKLALAMALAFDRWVTRCAARLEPVRVLVLPPTGVRFFTTPRIHSVAVSTGGNKLQRKLDLDVRLNRPWTGRL